MPWIWNGEAPQGREGGWMGPGPEGLADVVKTAGG